MSPAKRAPSLPEVDDATLDDVLLSLIERHPDGLATSKVGALLPPAYRASKVRIEERLRTLASRGRVHRWSAKTVAPAPYAARAEAAVLDALADGPRTLPELKRSLPPTIRAEATPLKRALDALVKEGRTYEHPKPPGAKGGALRYAREPADAALYVAPVEKALTALLKKLAKTGLDRAALVAALGGAPQSSGAREVPRPAAAPVDRAVPDAKPTVAAAPGPATDVRRFFDAVLAVRPDARLHVLVSIREVRARLGWPKPTLDALVLDLAREGRITLHQHDHPAGLSPEERAELVADERGNHFIGLVLEEKT